MPSQRHILVTGGAGYLGSILVPLLLAEGHSVHVIDTFYFGEQSLAAVADSPKLTITREDILHQENLPHLFRDVDTVIHLASISNDPSCDLDPNLSIRTNFLATMALARRAQAEGVHQFIFMSSCSVYGASGSRLLDETSRTGPATLYALTKLESERELLRMASKEFPVTILRLATLFGYSPRMRFDLAVNIMTKRALQGASIVVNGQGEQYRPFVHVRDAAAAILSVLKTDSAVCGSQIFNVGGDALNYTIAALAKEVQAAFPGTTISQVAESNDIRSYRVQFKKIRDRCNWQPQRSILDGVQDIAHPAQQKLLGDMDQERYYNILVMKDSERVSQIAPSLAAAPRWSGLAPLPNSAVPLTSRS